MPCCSSWWKVKNSASMCSFAKAGQRSSINVYAVGSDFRWSWLFSNIIFCNCEVVRSKSWRRATGINWKTHLRCTRMLLKNMLITALWPIWRITMYRSMSSLQNRRKWRYVSVGCWNIPSKLFPRVLLNSLVYWCKGILNKRFVKQWINR